MTLDWYLSFKAYNINPESAASFYVGAEDEVSAAVFSFGAERGDHRVCANNAGPEYPELKLERHTAILQ